MKITRKGYYSITGPDGQDLGVQKTSRDECYEAITEDGRAGVFVMHCPDREVEITVSTPDPDPIPDPDPDPDPTPDPDPEGIPPVSFAWDATVNGVVKSGLPTTAFAGEVYDLTDHAVGDITITGAGTASDPAFIRGGTITGEGNGSVIVISGEHIIFDGVRFVNAQPRVTGQYVALRNCEQTGNGKNGVNLNGSDIVLANSEIHHNQPNGRDGHGIQCGQGVENVWIFGNHIHHNSGNGLQGAHNASANPPSGVYIYNNEFHSDREVAVGLKWADNFIIQNNNIHSYRRARANEPWTFDDGSMTGTWNSGSDGNGIVIGADNEPEGCTRIQVLDNHIHDCDNGTRVESATDPVIQGNTYENIAGTILKLDKQGGLVTFRANNINGADRGIYDNWREHFSLNIEGNTFQSVTWPVELQKQPIFSSSALVDNAFINSGPVIYGGTTAATADEINALQGASGNTVS